MTTNLREVKVGSTCTVKKLHDEGAVKRRIMLAAELVVRESTTR